MRSNAVARSPSSSFARVDHRLVEAAAGDPLGRALEPQDPLRVQRCEQIAGDDGEEQADQARKEEPSLDQLQARDRVGERVAEQDHDALVLERNRHLGEAAAAPVDGAALEPRGCASPSSATGSRATSSDADGVRVAEDERLVLEDRVDDDAGLEDGGRPLGELLLAADLRRVVARDSLRVHLQLVELRVHELGLERGHDDQIDEAERAGDDDEQRERESKPDPAEPGAAHVSAPGSGSRRRAR